MLRFSDSLKVIHAVRTAFCDSVSEGFAANSVILESRPEKGLLLCTVVAAEADSAVKDDA
jgi:hypothetical protein